MGDDNALKSAYDLAMERLRAGDAKAGVVRQPAPAERDTLDAQYRRDREQLSAGRDANIEKVRQGTNP